MSMTGAWSNMTGRPGGEEAEWNVPASSKSGDVKYDGWRSR